MNKYHCNYDIYSIPGLVFISLGYIMKILELDMTIVIVIIIIIILLLLLLLLLLILLLIIWEAIIQGAIVRTSNNKYLYLCGTGDWSYKRFQNTQISAKLIYLFYMSIMDNLLVVCSLFGVGGREKGVHQNANVCEQEEGFSHQSEFHQNTRLA